MTTFGVWLAGMKELLQHPKTLEITVYKERCQEPVSLSELRVIEDVKEHQLDAADTGCLTVWMQDMLNSADTDVHRSSKHSRD